MDGGDPIHVAVLIVCYNGGSDVIECLQSLAEYPAPPHIRLHTLVVDNHSHDGSAARIREAAPWVEVLESLENLGFAGGNNLGWEHLKRTRPQTRHLMLLNQDTLVTPGWLDPLVTRLERDPKVAAVQPLIMLYPEVDLINTAGNRSHYLGFTFVTQYRERPTGEETCGDVDSVSGAACLLRMSHLCKVGLFESDMFMYCEDVDLSWKLRERNWRLQLVPTSRVYHRYEFKSPGRSYFYLQRNRLWLLYLHYRWRTLMLLLPAMIVGELGQLAFVVPRGLMARWAAAWWDTIRPRRQRFLLPRRREVQRRRELGDRAMLAAATARIDFAPVDHPLLRWIANPLWVIWWKLVFPLIRW